MTSHTSPSPARTYRIVMVLSAAAVAVALTACRGVQQPKAEPSPSATSVSATPTPPAIFGKLNVVFALTTPDSVTPKPPLAYTLVIRTPGADSGAPFPVNPDGTFALTMRPGSYEVWYLMVEGADLGPRPISLPLAGTKLLVLYAPATGCVFGGNINVFYGRLPAVSEKQQDALVAQASRNNHEEYRYVYDPKGGFVMAGASVSMPVRSERPVEAQSCTAEQFTWT